MLISPVHAAWPAEMDEFKIKAAMLYNFTKYVEWPPETGAAGKQLNVCITGNSPIKRHIDQLQGKQANGRTLAVRFVTSPDEISGCNMLFIDSSEYRRLSAFLQQGSRKPMLTVSDISQFASLGGMIGFFEQDDKIRFEINQDATLQAGITISSKLLKLARLVKGGK
ncbi:MAG: YfiR family protein [Desulfuromonadales bacterium]